MKSLTIKSLLLGALVIGLCFTACEDDEPADLCENVICENGGTCDNGNCDCPEGFTGDNCEEEIFCYEANQNNEWSYDDFGGPDCWSAVCSHGDCLGDKQSPIDITNPVTTTDLPTLGITGNNQTTTDIHNNGHTIEFKQQPGSFITYGQTDNGLFDDYTLGQFHFHANSEHQVDATYAPLEAHFVCRSIWRNDYIVLSVMFEEGESNPFLAQFVANLPAGKDQSYTDEELKYKPFDLLPANRSYYNYQGSLTTPPCSEVVNWIVMENKVMASKEEIEAFASIMGENFRPVQDLNGRVINYVMQ